jgi:hypothetical protein
MGKARALDGVRRVLSVLLMNGPVRGRRSCNTNWGGEIESRLRQYTRSDRGTPEESAYLEHRKDKHHRSLLSGARKWRRKEWDSRGEDKASPGKGEQFRNPQWEKGERGMISQKHSKWNTVVANGFVSREDSRIRLGQCRRVGFTGKQDSERGPTSKRTAGAACLQQRFRREP